MKKISIQTKSFILLVCLAVVGSYICLELWGQLQYYQEPEIGTPRVKTSELKTTQPKPQAVKPKLNTDGWKTFSSQNLSLSFKYPGEWKILQPKTKKGYTFLEIDPGKKYYNIKVVVSPKDYYIMGGLPTNPALIGGQNGLNVLNLLYGVKVNGKYYTFDIGESLSLKQEFNALVDSVQFQNN